MLRYTAWEQLSLPNFYHNYSHTATAREDMKPRTKKHSVLSNLWPRHIPPHLEEKRIGKSTEASPIQPRCGKYFCLLTSWPWIPDQAPDHGVQSRLGDAWEQIDSTQKPLHQPWRSFTPHCQNGKKHRDAEEGGHCPISAMHPPAFQMFCAFWC